ncbi:MAG: tRNA pseudouridine(65) synthase TruC [Planctomycetaceae bacterium]|nr:tRNA pseudouridine(65) synthase TruC [Planctomycetaceae bacterium]
MPGTSHPDFVIFEDEHLAAVHKPTGIFVHRTDGWDRHLTPLLQTVRKTIGQRVYTIHRLDRATSGVVLFGKTKEASSELHAMFRERRVKKTYVALVRGYCDDCGTIEFPLRPRQPNSADKSVPISNVELPEQECCTRYVTNARYELPFKSTRYDTTRCSLATLHPETGRWHQIRRHVNRIGHPVIGDTTHGDNTQNRFFRQQFGLSRLMLAATGLSFVHPWTQKEITISCPPSPSFQEIVDRICQWSVRI